MALRQAKVGGQLVDPLVDRLALYNGQLADRAGQDVARAAGHPRVSVEFWFCNTIWRGRVAPRLACPDHIAKPGGRSSSSIIAAGIGAFDAQAMVLASVDLPEPDSPTSPSVSPSRSSSVHADHAGASWPLWWNVLDTPLDGQRHLAEERSPPRRSMAASSPRPAGRCDDSATSWPLPTSTTGGTTVPAQLGRPADGN